MGKKTRKTRWRALSIGEGPSDDSQNGDNLVKGTRGSRWNATNSGSSTSRYNSSQSTPIRQRYDHNSTNSSRWSSRDGKHYQSQQNGAATSTRSSSITSETKITFNEDEYTKITTPRQDVLFKKGYLSKPKPHLQRPLTSAGNSTGDGTPDHQSADGTDYFEGDFEPQFCFPGGGNSVVGGGYLDTETGVYYVNGYDNYNTPVIFYDAYGNAMCFPPPLVAAQPPESAGTSSRIKRYSTDSVPESTSPHNESNPDQEPADDENETFLDETSVTSSTRKKRRRKKHCRATSTSEEEAEAPSESTSAEVSEETKCKYRVDAEEFIPRLHFIPPPPPLPQAAFVPLLPIPGPHDLFPGAFVFVPGPPPTYYPSLIPPQTQIEQVTTTDDAITTNETTTTENETSTTEAAATNETTTTTTIVEVITEKIEENPIENETPVHAAAAIDIAKIVSKLEQAAKEQKLMEDIKPPEVVSKEQKETNTNKCIKETPNKDREYAVKETKVEERQQKKILVTNSNNNNKTESKIMSRGYSDQLKKKNNTPYASKGSNKSSTVSKSSENCPRLERTASKPSTSILTATIVKTSNNLPNKSPTEWISVSGKKKRKSKIGETTCDSSIAVDTNTSNIVAEVSQTSTIKESNPQLIKEVTVVQSVKESTPESVEDANTQVVKCNSQSAELSQASVEVSPTNSIEKEKPKKERTKKVSKKRIIITDPSPVESITTAQEISVKTEAKEAIEVKQVKKKKHKKQKGHQEVTSSAEESKESSDTQDVSLELDRMIQRGLYANLEQRLNPADQFLVDVLRRGSIPPGSVTVPRFGPLPFMLPKMRYPSPKSASIHNPIPHNQTSDIGSHDLSPDTKRFPITKAVKEWMNKTRENTPEVEIFKHPQEIREEFLLDVDDKDLEDDFEDDHVDQQLPCQNIEEKKCNGFESTPDLLDCWEEDPALKEEKVGQEKQKVEENPGKGNDKEAKTHAGAEVEAVERGEDVLQSYESLYGCSGDFARIQNEVHTLHRTPRSDAGLPYRAICCTVM